MIRFNCQCGQAMKAAPEHGGKKARCPKCQGLVPIPLQDEVGQPPPPPVMEVVDPGPAITPRPRRRPRDDDDDDYEEERPRKRKRRRRSGGVWADCPKCGCPGDAERVYWTWWGGLIGPMIINTVRCHDCGTQYNGNTGKSNTTAIMIYFGISLGLAMVIICLGVLAEAAK